MVLSENLNAVGVFMYFNKITNEYPNASYISGQSGTRHLLCACSHVHGLYLQRNVNLSFVLVPGTFVWHLSLTGPLLRRQRSRSPFAVNFSTLTLTLTLIRT